MVRARQLPTLRTSMCDFQKARGVLRPISFQLFREAGILRKPNVIQHCKVSFMESDTAGVTLPALLNPMRSAYIVFA